MLQASRKVEGGGDEHSKVEGGGDEHSARLFLVWLGLQLLHMLLLFTVSLLWAVGSVRAFPL
jgi:hypothetical protein